jgi:hypothetical protein
MSPKIGPSILFTRPMRETKSRKEKRPSSHSKSRGKHKYVNRDVLKNKETHAGTL